MYLSFDDDRLARLGPYAVEFRYLGVKAPEVSLEEAETAIDALLAWAGKQIGARPR